MLHKAPASARAGVVLRGRFAAPQDEGGGAAGGRLARRAPSGSARPTAGVNWRGQPDAARRHEDRRHFRARPCARTYVRRRRAALPPPASRRAAPRREAAKKPQPFDVKPGTELTIPISIVDGKVVAGVPRARHARREPAEGRGDHGRPRSDQGRALQPDHGDREDRAADQLPRHRPQRRHQDRRDRDLRPARRADRRARRLGAVAVLGQRLRSRQGRRGTAVREGPLGSSLRAAVPGRRDAGPCSSHCAPTQLCHLQRAPLGGSFGAPAPAAG